ncbi:low-complexity tail membrane protein [Ancylothrix sp. C2]|uniref:low-complexity tail membrane protein n=1 Tax=Ancylothrix sp. D3o TaxID=2953691 RepID=UPI0021BB931C|nr:low-complexity tail membrane protein [Ancylothrix sp. D3o]MCT7951014.1 low-complexity tail membrane protein [Ancylothrix sp. D3o]
MRSFWTEPFLWIHLAGFFALPLCVLFCLFGLAAGTPLLPPFLEVLLVGLLGTGPVLAMQLWRPFYIFAALFVATNPDRLSADQLRLLTLLKTNVQRIAAVVAAALLLVPLWFLYQWAPVAALTTPLPQVRLLGLLVAALAFLGCNLFLLLPVSVAILMLTNEAAFATTETYPADMIRRDFTIFGWQLGRVLPPLTSNFTAVPATPQPQEAPPTPPQTPHSS